MIVTTFRHYFWIAAPTAGDVHIPVWIGRGGRVHGSPHLLLKSCVPIVKVFKNESRTALRTTFRAKFTRLHVQPENLLRDDNPPLPQIEEATPWTLPQAHPVLVPDTDFCLARQRSHCSCFTKRPLRRRPSYLQARSQDCKFGGQLQCLEADMFRVLLYTAIAC